jgi:hypothetical protein
MDEKTKASKGYNPLGRLNISSFRKLLPMTSSRRLKIMLMGLLG